MQRIWDDRAHDTHEKSTVARIKNKNKLFALVQQQHCCYNSFIGASNNNDNNTISNNNTNISNNTSNINSNNANRCIMFAAATLWLVILGRNYRELWNERTAKELRKNYERTTKELCAVRYAAVCVCYRRELETLEKQTSSSFSDCIALREARGEKQVDRGISSSKRVRMQLQISTLDPLT